jgi:hypothetical protein
MKGKYFMELLLYEKATAFFHRLWSRYYLLGLYEYSPELLEAHNRQIRTFAYSAVQDAFYALDGATPNGSPAGLVWQAVVKTKNFKLAQQIFTDGTLDHKVNITYWLGLVFENFIQPKNKPDDPKAGGKQESPLFDQESKSKPQKQPDNKPQKQQPGNQPTDEAPGNKPDSFDLAKDSAGDILTGGKEMTEDPGDMPADPNAGVGGEYKLSVPPGFRMPSLDGVQAANDMDDVMGSFMGTEIGTPTDKRRTLETFHHTLAVKNLSQFLGFAEHIVKAAARKREGAAGFHRGMTKGRWDGKVTVNERRQIIEGNPMALMRFADRKLRKFKVVSEVPVGNGPVFLLRDESESMRDRAAVFSQYDFDARLMPPYIKAQWEKFLAHPDKDTQAVNLEIALAYHFAQSGRSLTSIPWDNKNHRIFKYGTPGLEDHLNTFFDGGTAINHVLDATLAILERPGADTTNADILILTDAAITDRPQNNKPLWERITAFRKRGGRIWAVLIGCDSDATIRTWVDGAITIEQLTGAEKGLEKILIDMAISRGDGERENV